MQPWEAAGVKPEDDCCSLMFSRVFPDEHIGELEHLLGYVFVIEPARDDPKYKIPGGHRKHGEDPLQAGLRELEGESGAKGAPEHCTFINAEWKRGVRDHWSCLFAIDMGISELPWLNSFHDENEGEVPKFLTLENFRDEVAQNGILWPHLRRLREQKLID